MSELLELIQTITLTNVGMFLMIVYILYKGLGEFLAEVKKHKNNFNEYVDEKIDEKKAKEVAEERIKKLESHDDSQYEMIRTLCKTIDEIKEQLATLSNDFKKDKEIRYKRDTEQWIDNTRREIIDAGCRLRNGDSLSDDMYRRIFRLNTEYEKVIEREGLTNGEVELSMQIIQKHYIEDLPTPKE